MATIVVGVDGSESAQAALDFAAEEAAVRGATLRVVSVWEVSERVQISDSPVPEVLEHLNRMAQGVVDEAVGRVKQLQPELPCEGLVLFGRPQAVIVEEAKGATLIVVGRRGRGGLASLLLGSVSQDVVNSAPCPVVVVPPPAK